MQINRNRIHRNRINRNRIESMATRTLMISAVILGATAGVRAQVPVSPEPNALTSRDYLRMMEEANSAAGIAPVGGGFVGAKPRPNGSLATPPASVPPASVPHTFAPSVRAALPTPPPTFAPSALEPTAVQQSNPQELSSPSYSPGYSPGSPGSPGYSIGAVPEVGLPTSNSFVAQGQPSRTPQSVDRALGSTRWEGPRWVGRYASIGMRRPGDESLTFSQGGQLGTFGSDTASEVSVGYMTNPMDCYEFSYLGSLNWIRANETTGPVSSSLSSLDPQWLNHFQNADLHQQHHSAKYRQYGFERRWLTDDIGNSRLGMRVIDYSEQYRLRSLGFGGEGRYGLDTGNLLVGIASGMELWRPISQRVALGGSIDGGLYANFAEAGNQASDGNGRDASVVDQDLSLAASLGLHLRARYQLRSWAGLYGGYRWMLLTGVATVDDQAPSPLADTLLLSTSSDASLLFHGFDAGLEFKF
ncbi:MAG: hypothetical protein NTV29_13520 [Planctomycetota bacterium]|nr:hypothetical protein [Planctomycetota bacterium]